MPQGDKTGCRGVPETGIIATFKNYVLEATQALSRIFPEGWIIKQKVEKWITVEVIVNYIGKQKHILE